MTTVIAFWSAIVALGVALLVRYSVSPGELRAAPRTWPSDSRIERTEGLPAVLMVVHPRCPCSAASIEEFGRLVAQGHGQATFGIIVIRPAGTEEGWENGRILRLARSLPGVPVWIDPEGEEAQKLHARTSGIVFVYDRHGRLAFEGGITPSRGHEGDSIGRVAALSVINQDAASNSKGVVFGCQLFGPCPAEKKHAEGANGRIH